MTVCCWDGKTLASDSLIATGDGHFFGSDKKLFKLSSGAILGCAGDADIRELLGLLQNVKDEVDIPTRKELESTKTGFSGLLVLPNKSAHIVGVYEQESEHMPYIAEVCKVTGRYAAIGHGEQYALAALDMGADAVKAVKAAIKRSLFCRGPIQTLTLESKTKPVKVKKKKIDVPVDEGIS